MDPHVPPNSLPLALPMSAASPPLPPLQPSELDNFQFLHFLTPLSFQDTSRLQYFFLYDSKEYRLTWSCMVSLLPPWHSVIASCCLKMLLLRLTNSGIPENRSSLCSLIRFGFLGASPKPVGAILRLSGLGVNIFTICRFTPFSCFENPALVSSDSNTISYIHIPGAPFRLTQTDFFIPVLCTTSPQGNVLLIPLSLPHLVF